MRKVRIAQIGTSTNSHGEDIFRTLLDLPDCYEVVGYALPENEREEFPNRMSYFEGLREMTVEEILNDPTIEAVTVENEEPYLTKYALMAAKHGKHVHMEKPGGMELVDFEQLIATMKQTGKVFHTGYMYRYNPEVQKLLQQVKDGELGEIVSVEAQMDCNHPKRMRDWLGKFPGGMMFFLGCHLVDLVMLFQGVPSKVIPLNCSTGLQGVTADDFGMAVMKYPRGVSFVKTTDTEVGGFGRRQLVVAGSNGTVELKPLEVLAWCDEVQYRQYTERHESIGEVSWVGDWKHSRSDYFGRYNAMMRAFAAYVTGEEENPYTPDYELAVYTTVLKCCGALPG